MTDLIPPSLPISVDQTNELNWILSWQMLCLVSTFTYMCVYKKEGEHNKNTVYRNVHTKNTHIHNTSTHTSTKYHFHVRSIWRSRPISNTHYTYKILTASFGCMMDDGSKWIHKKKKRGRVWVNVAESEKERIYHHRKTTYNIINTDLAVIKCTCILQTCGFVPIAQAVSHSPAS